MSESDDLSTSSPLSQGGPDATDRAGGPAHETAPSSPIGGSVAGSGRGVAPPHGAGAAPSPPGASADAATATQFPGYNAGAWAGQLSDRVVETVGWLKARTTVRVVTVLRGIVYGLIALIALVTALMLATVGLVRMWDVYFPLDPVGRRVWLGYVVLGGILFLAGVALLARKKSG